MCSCSPGLPKKSGAPLRRRMLHVEGDSPEGEAGRPCSEVHEGLSMSPSGMHNVPLLRAQEFGCVLCWDCWQCALVASANKTTKKPAQVPSLSVKLSAAWAGQASLQSVKSWLFWSRGERYRAGISTFRTRSERPGVHKIVAGYMGLRTQRGHETCFRLCSCSAHFLVCCDLSS